MFYEWAKFLVESRAVAIIAVLFIMFPLVYLLTAIDQPPRVFFKRAWISLSCLIIGSLFAIFMGILDSIVH